MRYNELYEVNRFLTDKDKILRWMIHSFFKFDPDKLTIEPDGLIYDGSLELITTIKELKVNFKSVYGSFFCNQRNIESLEGCPKLVGGNFNSGNSSITSLKFCPQSVGTDFYCNNIKITDLKEYRYALYSEIVHKFYSGIGEIDEIINTYRGSANRKYWPKAINLLGEVKL